MATEEYSIGYSEGYQEGWNAAQKPFVGLTDEEIRNWWRIENGLEDCKLSELNDFTLAVRAIEAKLREKNGGGV